jgi:two-component system, cell cycle sensor histidine kinase and response regulator CckA
MPSNPPVILVVEDDPVLAEVLGELLQHAGYTVERAADGAAGAARIEAGHIDLVLLDLMLPDVDGLELCRRARTLESDVYLPIIMLTVLGEQQRHAGFLAGADDYVAKPFDADDLLDRVQVWLRTRLRLRLAHLRLLEEHEALREARTDLERQVVARTAQLEWANAQLRAEMGEREQAQVALRASEEQLRQSQKMEAVGQLAGGIAHDFNNLLTVINGFTELLGARLAPDDPLASYIAEIGFAGERASALTRQLLAFSRRQVLQPKVLDVNEVVIGMQGMLRRLISEDISVEARLDPALGHVEADPSQLEQVVLNLVVNARDAMRPGGAVTIHTANVEVNGSSSPHQTGIPSGSYVCLSIADTGCGMDAETRQRIFEPFFTTKEQGKGTGLGLSTVYGIVKQSGGEVRVQSEPGRGTTFEIYLPRALTTAEPAAAPNAPRFWPLGGETILLVEDEEQVRDVVREALEAAGYAVLEAPSGDEALRLAARHDSPIHLLVTDVVMPGLSGRQLADTLVASHPEARVLYMSAYTDQAIVHQGVLEPGLTLIQKPFTLEALGRAVRAVLDA